jgi:hypothetical protein
MRAVRPSAQQVCYDGVIETRALGFVTINYNNPAHLPIIFFAGGRQKITRGDNAFLKTFSSVYPMRAVTSSAQQVRFDGVIETRA